MKKQGAATLKDGLQRRFLRNGRRQSAKPTIKLHAVLYTAAAVETIWCNNSTHWDVQPTIALSAVLCCRYTVRASDQPSKQSLLRRRPWNTVVMFLLLLLGLFLVVGQRTAGDDARKCRSQGDWFQRITNL